MAQDERKPASAAASFFHPYSGMVILGLDWLAFGLDLLTDFLGLPMVCLATFAVTFILVEALQRRLAGDSPGRARLKALIGATAAGLPFPVTGTLLGTAILILSGLRKTSKD